MNFSELAKSRYSVRAFSDKKIEDDKLQLILQAAQAAPTACNNQPQRLYVLHSEDAIKTLSSVTKFVFGAKTAIIFTSVEEEEWKNPFASDYYTGEIDVSIACTHAMLQAWELGVGSCWVGYFDPQKVKKAFNIPENEKIIAILPIGYPAQNSVPSAGHFSRKPLDKTVKYL